MKTRQDYIRGKISHDNYYAQFVNKATKQRVIDSIGIKRLLKSKDEHLNDIPMKKWDMLGGFVWAVRGGQEVAIVKPQTTRDIEPIDYKLLKEAGEGVSSSTMVCIYKNAARQIMKEHKQ